MYPNKSQRWWLLLSLLMWWSTRAIAAPVNDNFADAIVITNFPTTISGNNFGATVEPGEFDSTWYPVEGSVWWKWTAPFTGRLGIVDDNSPGSPWLKVCVGDSVASLTNLISRNLYVFNVLNVTEGTTYYFDMDRNMSSGEGGPFQFQLVSFPTNDNFADAITLTGAMLETFADNRFATAEPGEPNYTSGYPPGSIWWNWTAPEPGLYRITGNPSLHIFTGDSVSNLTLVTFSDSGPVELNAVSGVVYRIRMTSGAETVRLAIYPPVPPNDDFEDRLPLSGSQVDQFGTTVGATGQAQDPLVAPFQSSHTVWYSWTAPDAGRVAVTALNLTGHPLFERFVVGVFAGDQLGTLQKLAGASDGVSVDVEAGRTYVIDVSGDVGDFRLKLNLVSRPLNDDFTNRLVLSGSIANVTNSNFAATVERGEKQPARNTAGASLWYEWTSPADGLARAAAQADGFVPVVCVYQGSSVRSLKKVAKSLSQDSTGVFCSFHATSGKTYVMSVDGLYPDGRGNILFGVDLTTFQVTNPVAGELISSATPPLFAVNEPLPAVDGTLESVAYFGISPAGEWLSLGESTLSPFSIVPTNLPPGVVTLFAVGTNTVGDVRLTPPVSVKVRPVNDDFAQSLPLTGYQWQASGWTAQATKERGEPAHGRASVWWKWTAPSSGRLWLGAQAASLGKRKVALYTGSELRHLVRLRVAGKKSPYFQVTGGTTYHLAVAANNPNLDPGTWPFEIDGSLESLTFSEPTNTVFHETEDVPIGITVTEDPVAIQSVEFLVSDGYTNGQLLASVSTPPFRFVWSNAPPGNYTVEARVTKTAAPNPPSISRQFSVRPINDNFAGRIVLSTNFSWLTHRITGASREPGEPAHFGNAFAPSAWWSWTAPADGELHLSDPEGITFGGFAVYTGTNLASLTSVTNRAYPPYAYHFESQVRGGTTYQIAAVPGSTPDVNAQLRFFPPPPNDDFSNRVTLAGSSVSFEGYTILATREPDEPAHIWNSADHTIWWTWTAPGPGSVSLRLTEGLYTYYRVYTGDTWASLQAVTPAGSSSQAFSFETQSNQTYQIVVVGDYGGEERVGGRLEFVPAVMNDVFATRTLLEGTNLKLIVDNCGASAEAGEPPLAPGASGRTLWWSWTAPADGMLYARLLTGAGHPRGSIVLEAFQGDSIASQEPVPGSTAGDQIYFYVMSNETYQIRFDAPGPISDVPVELVFVAAPPNDQFADATVLHGLDFATNGSLRGASPEPGDPPVWPGAPNTVWYSWTAPQSGNVIVAVTEAADYYSLQAFTGSSLSNLTVAGVRRQNDSVWLDAQAATTYYFVVAGFWSWEPDWPGKGPFRLQLLPGGPPANDGFANAHWVAGTSATIAGTNWGASLEPDDPPIVAWNNLKRTLWYQWQAPASGILILTNAGSTADPIAGVYLGTNLNQLWLIGGNGETPVRANEIVHILADLNYGQGGVIRLTLGFQPAPANDDFAQAIPITGTSCSLTGEVRTATGEYGNPSDRTTYQYRDVWWKWTAPGSGHVVVTNMQAGSNPGAWIYTGTAVTNLQLITWLENGWLQFDALGGTNYWVRVSWGPDADIVNLNLVEELNLPKLSVHSSLDSTVVFPPPPRLKLVSPQMLPDSRFKVRIQGAAGTPYQVEYSNDLVTWKAFHSGVLENDEEELIDAETGTATRFYRLR